MDDRFEVAYDAIDLLQAAQHSVASDRSYIDAGILRDALIPLERAIWHLSSGYPWK